MSSSTSSFLFPPLDPALSLPPHSTRYKIMKGTQYWYIKNFSFCTLPPGEKLESPVLHMGPKNELVFRLKLYPRGFTKFDFHEENGVRKEFVSVFVGLISNKLREQFVPTKFKISLLNFERKEIKSLSCKRSFEVGRFRGWRDFIKRKDIFKPSCEYFPADQLLVCCELTVAVDGELLDGFAPPEVLKIPNSTLSEDVANLYKSRKLSDFNVDVNGKRFPVHKAMLTARSPVFAAMIRQNMIEKNRDSVEIADFDAEIIDRMLQFMYSADKTLINTRLAKDLLRASDKYEIESMKQVCESQLCKMVNCDTALEMYTLAVKHKAQNLRSKCLEFITCFPDQVLIQENNKLNPELAPFIFDDILDVKEQPSRSD